MLRIAKNVKETNQFWQALKKRKRDWGLDPAFVAHNQTFDNWERELPRDLQVQLPTDGSTPWISSHFVGQLHTYHQLSVVMHHRPQIHFLSDAGDQGWRSHMLLCHSAAKIMCRLQEAIVEKYGLEALSCMQRGISFTIYSILTCTMLHLVRTIASCFQIICLRYQAAITAPDPDLHSDAPDYFCRHMRLLEHCVPLWDMPDVNAQINSLREAFSADLSKPFELKRTFPHGSPPAHRPSQSPPFHPASTYGPVASAVPQAHDGSVSVDPASGQMSSSLSNPCHAFAMPQPLTPPISTTDSEPKTDSPIGQSLVSMQAGQMMASRGPTSQNMAPPGTAEQQAPTWNPTRLFEYVLRDHDTEAQV